MARADRAVAQWVRIPVHSPSLFRAFTSITRPRQSVVLEVLCYVVLSRDMVHWPGLMGANDGSFRQSFLGNLGQQCC